MQPLYRHLFFFTVYLSLYAIVILTPPLFGFIALWFGYIGVLAIGRAWAQNENLRARIAKKLEESDPDSLPDLRGTAGFAALQMVILVPLLLRTSDGLFDLYATPAEATMTTWALFALDLLFRSILDWSEVYGVHISGVGLKATGGRHLVMFILLSIDYMVIQTAIRIIGINTTIEEGVAVAGKDPEMAFRLGRRASPRLSRILLGEEREIDEKRNIIEAMGLIGDASAAEALVESLAEVELHAGAIASLVMVGHFDSLFKGIRHSNPAVRRGCISALGRLEDSVANEILAEAIRDSDASVRSSAFRAIGRIAHPSDIPLLRVGIADEVADVRYAALQQFSNFTGEEAMEIVFTAMADPAPIIRRLAAEILARYPHPRVVPILAAALQDDNPDVAAAASRSIQHLESLVKAGVV